MAASAQAGTRVRALITSLLFFMLGAGQAAAQTHVIVLTGASGEPAYARSFHTAAAALVDALVSKHGLARTDITWLAEDPARDAGRIDGKSSKDELSRVITRAASRNGDRLLLVLIGHGSHTGSESRLNLPGPDLTAAELGAMLEPLRSRQVAIVNAASASGDFVPVLSAKNRVVIAATKSSSERNETLFPQHFVAAFAAAGADTDKDERISLLEAFTYARREVARVYEAGSRLQTEHAVLDDETAARRFVVGGRTTSGASADRAVVTRRDELEAQVAALRARKDSMSPADYERELERLLVELARLNQSLRGGKPL
jgi:hypothetical protein